VIRSDEVSPGARFIGVRSFRLERNEEAPFPAYSAPVDVQVTQGRAQQTLRLQFGGTVYRFANPVTLVVDPSKAFAAFKAAWRITYTTELGDDIVTAPNIGQRYLTKLGRVVPIGGTHAYNELGGIGAPGAGSMQVEPVEVLRGREIDNALRVARKGLVVYDSGVVAAGAVIDTDVLNLVAVEQLLFIVDNAGAAARNLNETMYLEDSVTALLGPSLLRTVVAGAKESGIYGPGALATGSTFAVSRIPPPRARYQLVAGGAAAARLTIIGR
jgi:hypothetical protein